MKLGELVEKLQKLEKHQGSDTNVEINIESDDWSYDDGLVAHEIDRIDGWDDSKNQKWVSIYLK